VDEVPAVFRPNPGATAIGLTTLVAVGALPFVPGVIMLFEGTGVSVLLGVLLMGVGAAVWTVPWMIFSRYFSIRVDAEALSIVGLFALWRVTLAWHAIDFVGVAPLRAPQGRDKINGLHPRWLVVRPKEPLASTPRWAWRWAPETRLLYIAGLENWHGPAEGLEAAVQRCAGDTWQGDIDLGQLPGD
jgi:hypothetical protein